MKKKNNKRLEDVLSQPNYQNDLNHPNDNNFTNLISPIYL